MKLTYNQQQFILEEFFKNDGFIWWREIALKLLEKGTCIVAGDKCIWNGGVGNFIKTETSEDAIGCLVYNFDLYYFLSSEWFKGTYDAYLVEVEEQIMVLKQKHDELLKIKEW